MWTRESLHELIENQLRDVKFIVVSNREPYLHRQTRNGVECVRPASGMATALDPIMRAAGGIWVAAGSGNADSRMVDRRHHVAVPPENPSYTLRRVWIGKQLEADYYYGMANEGLWPLCHIAFQRPSFRRQQWEAYREANEIFARAVLEEAEDEPAFVFIQDYHFGLLPRMLKENNPNLILAQFWHIPWPNSETFRAFPWGEELLDGMLGNDLLGFHLRHHCANFLDTVDRGVEAMVDHEHYQVTRGGRVTTIRPFPISIDFELHSSQAVSPETDLEMARWRRDLRIESEFLGVGIDRIDYTKGIPDRLKGLDLLFERYPQYRGRLSFVQIGVPSRSRIPSYRDLQRELDATVGRINRRWGTRRWKPILLLKGEFPQTSLMALERMADFCVVSSLHDGMNLVAKEYVSSRSDGDGVLILSRFAGAARELSDALMVNPFTPDEMAEAMDQALSMAPEERRRRMARMRATVEENNIYRWGGKILSTLLRFEFPETAEGETATAIGSTGAIL